MFMLMLILAFIAHIPIAQAAPDSSAASMESQPAVLSTPTKTPAFVSQVHLPAISGNPTRPYANAISGTVPNPR